MKISILILAILLSGCVKEWKDPNTSIPATELSISKLLLTPAIYQREGVKTTGKIWNLTYLTENEYELKFILADEDGYYVEILSESEIEVGEGDIVEVTGQFIREYIKEENHYNVYIIARKVDLLKN